MKDSSEKTLPNRRHLLAGLSLFSLLAGSTASALAATTQKTPVKPIRQPNPPSRHAFIDRAFAMRELASKNGDQAYGAIVVQDGKIIGQSESRVITDQDATAHAEMSALRDASQRAGRQALVGATLYSSSHPCSMCEAAAAWVGIEKMIYGEAGSDGGRPKSC